MISPHKIIPLCLALCLALLACARNPGSTADVPRLLPTSYKISVAPFTQPITPAQLITGQIPENQGRIDPDQLTALNMELRDVLMTDTKRQYNFLTALPAGWNSGRSAVQPEALERWLEYGKKHNAQLLLVPQVFDWHEREGSEAGVTSSAHVRLEFYLLNVDQGIASQRSIFEEKQVGLVDNLLAVGDFIKRKGQWVTARQLAIEGIRKAVGDLGL